MPALQRCLILKIKNLQDLKIVSIKFLPGEI